MGGFPARLNARRLSVYLLAAAALAASAWWALHVPRHPKAPWNAIPASATWLTAHDRLAERWGVLSENRLLASLAGAMGLETEDWENLVASPDTRRFLDIFGRDELVLAYVPEMPTTGRPAWVFASWLGGRSQRLRWSLKSVKNPELRPASARNGWRVWVWTPKGLKGGERVTFAIVEGMVVGCIATDTLGIEDVLACVDGLAPSLGDFPSLQPPSAVDAPDRGWVKWTEGLNATEPIRFSVEFLPNGGLRGTVTIAGNRSVARPPAATDSLSDFADLLGIRPTAVLVADRSLAASWIASWFPDEIGRSFAGLVSSETTGVAGFAVLGGEYSGRYRAVRLPSLLGAVSADAPTSAVQQVLSTLDRLNAVSPWGLIPQPVTVGTQRVYAIESTGRSLYAQAELPERVAFVPLNRSLVFSSNAGALIQLLREAQQGAAPQAPAALREGLRRMNDLQASAYFRIDLENGARMIRLAITAWSLKLLSENPSGSLAFRKRLNEAKAWVDAIAPQRNLEIWARPRQDAMEYHFVLGDSP